MVNTTAQKMFGAKVGSQMGKAGGVANRMKRRAVPMGKTRRPGQAGQMIQKLQRNGVLSPIPRASKAQMSRATGHLPLAGYRMAGKG